MEGQNRTLFDKERSYLDEVEAEIERLQNIRNAILKKPGNNLKLSEEQKINVKTTPYDSKYPLSGDKTAKILAILAINKKVLLQREIEDEIRREEGEAANDTLKSFYYVLNDKMLKQGLIAFLRVSDSYKYAFYALPTWLDENKKIRHDYLPDIKTWGNFPETKRKKIETEKWKIYKK